LCACALQPFNDATIYPGEIGNVFVIQPYAVRAARTPPYPQLTLVLVPLFLTQVSRVTRCLEGDASPSDECELGPLNLTTERLSPIELSGEWCRDDGDLEILGRSFCRTR